MRVAFDVGFVGISCLNYNHELYEICNILTAYGYVKKKYVEKMISNTFRKNDIKCYNISYVYKILFHLGNVKSILFSVRFK